MDSFTKAVDIDVIIHGFVHPADLPNEYDDEPVDKSRIYLWCSPLFPDEFGVTWSVPFVLDCPAMATAKNLYGTEYKNKIGTLHMPNYPSAWGARVIAITGDADEEAGAYCDTGISWNVGITVGV